MLRLLLYSFLGGVEYGWIINNLWIHDWSLVLPKEVNVVFGHFLTQIDLGLLFCIFLFVFLVLYWLRFAGSHHLLDDDVV